MPFQFAKRMEFLTPSLTLQIAAEAGKDPEVMNLSVGEPDFPTPDPIKEAGIAAIKTNFTKYTAGSGIPDLRKAVAERVSRETGIPRKPEEVVVSSGAKHSISSTILALVDVGEKVLIPTPCWLSYPEMVLLAQGYPIELPTTQEEGFRVRPAQLEAALATNPKLIILNSPSNPTGAIYHKKHLDALVPILKASGVLVISDEIYDKMLYDGVSYTSLASYPEIRDQVILINGVSKAYCMTGWRIGWAVAHADIIRQVGIVQSQMTSSACSISQKAAVEALRRPDSELAPMLAAFQERRDRALVMLNDIPGVKCPPPEGAFYLFPYVDTYLPPVKAGMEKPDRTMALARYLLRQHKVAVIPGCAFGDDNHIRLSFAAATEKVEEGVRRLAKGLQGYKDLSAAEREAYDK
jgi:aspartate aminotransferase